MFNLSELGAETAATAACLLVSLAGKTAAFCISSLNYSVASGGQPAVIAS